MLAEGAVGHQGQGRWVVHEIFGCGAYRDAASKRLSYKLFGLENI